MTIETTDPTITPAKPAKPEPTRRPSLLDEVFAASTPTNQSAFGGGELFRKRRVTFTVPRAACSVDFGEDFDLTIAELDAATEMRCASEARAKGELGLLYARASLHGLNGKPIGETHREWVWNAIGMEGRMLVAMAFHQHLAPAGDEEGKARMEATILGARLE